ncbi:hypothetical protein ACE6H2_016875 [Prunus campanulata]
MTWWRAQAASSTLFNRVLLHNQRHHCPTNQFNFDINSQLGRCMPLGATHAGQGGKLVLAPGTHATILKEVKLPSHVEKWRDSKCRATIGSVPSGPNSGNQHKKLYKAGQSRWLGCQPKVRGVAMNHIDHAHGGG